ncbi:M1 family metallopeptidase [Desertivirga arenae]|uniref:M1 family metallopeptidase n=1 Tax=Desertivirga arenae TaxID=2810309 RepID=UPI001A9799E6|nr:M1 family metallopeptidase [Pedobacter sp. SYSU D00823]
MRINRLQFSLLCFFCLCFSLSAHAQFYKKEKVFSRADSLRGSLTSLRSVYDITYYHLNVKVDPEKKFIQGSNLFKFKATGDLDKLQFDLFANLKVDSIVFNGKAVPFSREHNAVFINFPYLIREGSNQSFIVYYSGFPTVAIRAPWDGGFVFSKDAKGKPWIATACQGIGASVWFPNKDHQSDEVDSMLLSVSVPAGLKDISNGTLRKVTKRKDGYTQFDWFIANPINNYSVVLNIGDFVHFSDSFVGEAGKLRLDYWVLPENLNKAKVHFGANVKKMLKAFEHWFGPYPFYKDGYKLIEAPHLGMEHQSAVAYGNKFQNGYKNTDLSGTGWGMKWDFIIVHESGHEWFGNNITAKDQADMWIHESFTNYSESLFLDFHYGKKAGTEYVNGTRNKILNDVPIIPAYHVNATGSGDMYYKGGNLLNMIRTILNDDEKWRRILRGLNEQFFHQTVTSADVIGYINKEAKRDFSRIFDQYLNYTSIPVLEIRRKEGKLMGRWIANTPGFDMPVRLRVKGSEYSIVELTSDHFSEIKLPGATAENIEADTFNFYIGLLKV